jgi:hypothetical protein
MLFCGLVGVVAPGVQKVFLLLITRLSFPLHFLRFFYLLIFGGYFEKTSIFASVIFIQ